MDTCTSHSKISFPRSSITLSLQCSWKGILKRGLAQPKELIKIRWLFTENIFLYAPTSMEKNYLIPPYYNLSVEDLSKMDCFKKCLKYLHWIWKQSFFFLDTRWFSASMANRRATSPQRLENLEDNCCKGGLVLACVWIEQYLSGSIELGNTLHFDSASKERIFMIILYSKQTQLHRIALIQILWSQGIYYCVECLQWFTFCPLLFYYYPLSWMQIQMSPDKTEMELLTHICTKSRLK